MAIHKVRGHGLPRFARNDGRVARNDGHFARNDGPLRVIARSASDVAIQGLELAHYCRPYHAPVTDDVDFEAVSHTETDWLIQ